MKKLNPITQPQLEHILALLASMGKELRDLRSELWDLRYEIDPENPEGFVKNEVEC